MVGDPLYDGREESLNRVPPLMKEIAEKVLEIAPAQLLQAVKIELIHPRTGKKMKFKVPLEEPFAKVLKLLKKKFLLLKKLLKHLKNNTNKKAIL